MSRLSSLPSTFFSAASRSGDFGPPRRLPRRIYPDEARAALRLLEYGPPSELDKWISSNIAQCTTGPLDDLAHDDVACTLIVHSIPAPCEPDDYFADPPTFILYLTIRLSPLYAHVTEDKQTSPRAVLDQQRGLGGGLAEPEWTDLPLNTPFTFRQKRGYMANMFMDLALYKCNLLVPHLSALMIDWAWKASLDSPYELAVDEKIYEHGFGPAVGCRDRFLP